MLRIISDWRQARYGHAEFVALLSPDVWIGRAKERISIWLRRIRTRHDLSKLDDHLLRDVGLSRSDRYLETEKPFWR